MKILKSVEEKQAIKYLRYAADVASKSLCLRSKCGSIIVKNENIIGEGYNSPPGDVRLEKCFKDDLPDDFISDRTCCIHAEQRAIMDALTKNSSNLIGSRLYFVRLREKEEILSSNNPYCTICSKLTLDVGIDEFTLWGEEGVCVYDTEEYNKISFKFRKGMKK